MDNPLQIRVEPFDISGFQQPQEIILFTVTPDTRSTIPEIGQGCRVTSPQGYTIYGKVVSVSAKKSNKVEVGIQCESKDITRLFTF